MKTFTTNYDSPIGTIGITANSEEIIELSFLEQPLPESADIPEGLKACVKQIDEYFLGHRTQFSLNLKPKGTAFQQRVWRQLEKIPFGKAVSYGEIARSIGQPTACRAVGNANGRNPIPIIIPCHRVIGSNGHLAGYGSGIWRKEWLLNHEKVSFII